MAMSKNGGESKAKKAAPKAAAEKAESKKSEPAAPTAKKAAAKATAKKASSKKATAPKLTPPQMSLLEAIAQVTQPPGYVAEKKPEQKVVDALLRHKLVKKGKKDEKTKSFFVSISMAGKKFLDTAKSAPATKA
ncbi:MAG: hypothetical protein ACP5XB_20820 [Isosphaeraceae bacterium]